MSEENVTIRSEPASAADTVTAGSASAQETPTRPLIAFPPTRWTLVLEAAEGDEDRAQQAMTELCEHYHSAIQGYFRMKCRDSHTADDLAGGFVLHLLERNRFRNFERRENMRFRNYLSRALKYFLCDHLPQPPSDPVEPYLEKAGENPELEKHMDAQVARATHQRALATLHKNYGRHGKAWRVERLKGFLLQDPEGGEYRQAASDLRLTANALHQAVFRLRHDYYEQFRAEVAQTVRYCKEELDEETRYLMALLPAALAGQTSES